MSSNAGIYKGPKTLTIMPTYTCPAECEDCGTKSSPRDTSNIDISVIENSIWQAKELGFSNIVFSGGEATLRKDELIRGIEYSKSLGMPTRLVTNAHWAINDKSAESFINDLLVAGLDEINFSTGDEHVRFIPLERVVTATVAAVNRNLLAHIMIEVKRQCVITVDSILEHIRIKELPEDKRKLVKPVKSPWMPLNPRSVEEYPEQMIARKSNLLDYKGCNSILQTYVIQGDGRVGSCCGLGMRIVPELSVGKAEGDSFLKKAIEESEDDIFKLWLHYKGPLSVLSWASEKDPEIIWEDMYAHPCQACMRVYEDEKVRSVVYEFYNEVLHEIIQCAWLEEELIPKVLGRGGELAST